ncbi:2-octaprenyl-6-methoxyphenyl hydroxylase [Blochmannia endosymbiont of Colobopsis nipponica]|uniref:2-octaprenyl-6-methoxyphenyl hydroxylase n=1 Tax=Blochmannia endosymbiont of Colobopsis nipponica TaxID=2681987 RepID=UPI00178640EA|nr:2-octaprenyl-6-methoxyphenyl hydroxylase [Blochmannia endosymbiont of Colobopsis nipponica]QOI11170.1 2-octaprenyl-6-methoxyphenyl hydroxylase [Blochmannia endosymbiont of Colobopsis nipponica]
MSVVIYGGGISGIFLALMLSKLTEGRLKIDLISSHVFEEGKIHPSFDSRVVALTWGTCRALVAMGIWSVLSPHVTIIKKIEISSYLQCCNKIIITANDYRLSCLGYVVELNKLGINLFKLLNDSLSIRLHCPVTLKKIQRTKNMNLVVLDNGCEISARLLVAADGSPSSLGAMCNINWNIYDYQQIAVTSNITTTYPHYHSAFEKFTKYGLLALLPITHNRSGLIWCCSSKWRKEISSWTIPQFCHVLQDILGYHLGHVIGASQYSFYSLYSCIVERHISHRLALVGNAAQTLHPFAGQNLNVGFRDVISLAKILAKANSSGKDIGDYSVLFEYQESRQLDQKITANCIDLMVRLFSSKHYSLIISRNLGFFVLSHSVFLRSLLVKYLFSWIIR